MMMVMMMMMLVMMMMVADLSQGFLISILLSRSSSSAETSASSGTWTWACTMTIVYLQTTRWQDISKVVHEWFSEDRIPLTFVCESCYTKRGCSHLQKVSCKSKVKRRFHHSSFFQENLFGIIWSLNIRGKAIFKFYDTNSTMYEKLSWMWSS